MKNYLICFVLVLSAVLSVSAQQPQSSTAPLFAVNSKYTNGVAPGYAPTAGAGLVLNLGKGTANCLGTLVEYAGGTLTLTNSATNYVYLNVGSSCAPAFNTSAFSSANIWIAKVTTSGGAITAIDDVRTGFLAPGTGSGTLTGTGTSGDLSVWTGPSSLGDVPDFTYSTHTLAGGSSAIFDLSSASTFKAPAKAGATAAADGQIAYDTTNKNTHVRANGADAIVCPFASTPTTGHVVDTSVTSSVVLCHDSGFNSADVLHAVAPSLGYAHFPGSSQVPTSVTIPRAIPFTIGDPAGSALTVASTTTDYVTVPFACTISSYHLMLVPSGTITVKFWKKSTGTAIPTSSDSISTSGVGISSGTAVDSSTTSDFTTTTVSANDKMAMNVTAVSTAAFVNGVLTCDESQ